MSPITVNTDKIFVTKDTSAILITKKILVYICFDIEKDNFTKWRLLAY